MQADFVLEYDTLKTNQTYKLHLMARFISHTVIQQRERRPLNLSLVIDRSGSMAGDKIDFTRQAAQFLVQNLSASDLLSIVLYNDRVDVLLPPEPVLRKDIINQRIAEIKASGTTNLSGGWLEGCQRVAQSLDAQAINRVILMSDGLANRGVTETDQLTQMARQKFSEGISTTTMGLGQDFNEDLLMEMASAGGGAFYFIESPEVTPLIFKEELSGLLSVVGQNLTITLEASPYLQMASQLNAYPMHTDGKATSYRLGDVFGDEIKALLLELTVAAIPQPGSYQIGLLRFEYDELNNDGTQHRQIELPIHVTISSAENAIITVNPEVQQSVLLLRAAQARRSAVKSADKGLFDSAVRVLREVVEAIDATGSHDPKLLEERAALIQQASTLEHGEASYDRYRRKSMSTQAFYTMTSRHEDTVVLRMREQEHEQKNIDSPTLQPPATPPKRTATQEIRIEKREGIPPTHLTWKEHTYELSGQLVRIGRSSHNEVIINANGVSRFHCQLIYSEGQWVLEDLGSTNGTVISGVVLKSPHILNVGDVAYLCDEKVIFHDGGYHES